MHQEPDILKAERDRRFEAFKQKKIASGKWRGSTEPRSRHTNLSDIDSDSDGIEAHAVDYDTNNANDGSDGEDSDSYDCNENGEYECHMSGCSEVFDTAGDRDAHSMFCDRSFHRRRTPCARLTRLHLLTASPSSPRAHQQCWTGAVVLVATPGHVWDSLARLGTACANCPSRRMLVPASSLAARWWSSGQASILPPTTTTHASRSREHAPSIHEPTT